MSDVKASYDNIASRATMPDIDSVETAVAREDVRARLFPDFTSFRRMGRYELRQRLGSGGVGLVFVAYDPQLDREIAIKVLRETTSNDEQAQQQLLAEARAIARLHHPNVVSVFDAGVDDERVFVAMELIEGCSLDAWLAQERPAGAVIDVLLGAGEGLAAAHDAGLVHRDFKPANVLVGQDGRARVVDFGLARRSEPRPEDAPASSAAPGTHTTSVAGTPLYMSPEQYLGLRGDARSDQYAFCVALHEALFGSVPITANTIGELRDAVLQGGLKLPRAAERLPPSLCRLVERGLSRFPDERYADLRVLLAALRSCRADIADDLVVPLMLARVAPSGPLTRLRRYLALLPDGLDALPSCSMRALPVRLALRNRPLAQPSPRLAALLKQLSAHDEWLPLTLGRALLAAIYDAHFDSLADWAAFMRPLLRACLHGRLLAMLAQASGAQTALPVAARICRKLYQGLDMTTASEQGVEQLKIEHPPGALDELGRRELAVALELALEMTLGTAPQVRLLDRGPSRFALAPLAATPAQAQQSG